MASSGHNGAQLFQFPLSSSSVLKLQKGDITKWSVDEISDAIVNPSNERMSVQEHIYCLCVLPLSDSLLLSPELPTELDINCIIFQLTNVVGKCPELLCYSMEELESRVSFYTSMGIDEKDLDTMVYDYPKLLGFFSMEEMNGKVSYLKEFGLSNEDVGRLLVFKQEFMACSIEERWKSLVKYLYYPGISQDGMKKMLIIKPIVFCIDLESCIVPKNRRARWKNKQLEHLYDALKQEYDAVSGQKRELQAEVIKLQEIIIREQQGLRKQQQVSGMGFTELYGEETVESTQHDVGFSNGAGTLIRRPEVEKSNYYLNVNAVEGYNNNNVNNTVASNYLGGLPPYP